MKANQHSIEPLSHSVIENVIFVEKPKKKQVKTNILTDGNKMRRDCEYATKKKTMTKEITFTIKYDIVYTEKNRK